MVYLGVTIVVLGIIGFGIAWVVIANRRRK